MGAVRDWGYPPLHVAPPGRRAGTGGRKMSSEPGTAQRDERIPVEIHLVLPPRDSRACEVADHLARTFSNGGHDPTAPALRIPTHRWPTVGGYPVRHHPADGRTLIARLEDAELAVVVILVDK